MFFKNCFGGGDHSVPSKISTRSCGSQRFSGKEKGESFQVHEDCVNDEFLYFLTEDERSIQGMVIGLSASSSSDEESLSTLGMTGQMGATTEFVNHSSLSKSLARGRVFQDDLHVEENDSVSTMSVLEITEQFAELMGFKLLDSMSRIISWRNNDKTTRTRKQFMFYALFGLFLTQIISKGFFSDTMSEKCDNVNNMTDTPQYLLKESTALAIPFNNSA